MFSAAARTLALVSMLCATLAWSRETMKDAAIIARRLVDSPLSIGTMATIFPGDNKYSPGEAFALQEYYASCHQNGSLTLILMPISQHSRNILRSSTHAASLTAASYPPAASKPRVSLMGTVTLLANISAEIQECYLRRHPDAKWWLPDDPDAPHLATWARFDPHNIYFVGGFGDKHYIGPIPLEFYQNSEAAESIAGRLRVQ